MSDEFVGCPVCLNLNGSKARLDNKNFAFDGNHYDCTACGSFGIVHSAEVTHFKKSDNLTTFQRSALSHSLRSATNSGRHPRIDSYFMRDFLDNAYIASPTIQLSRLIRVIGNYQERNGAPYPCETNRLIAEIGSYDAIQWDMVFHHAIEGALIKSYGGRLHDFAGFGARQVMQLGLLMLGWDRYETEKTSNSGGNLGFIAMQYKEPALDDVVRMIQNDVHNAIGYKVLRLDEIPKAGVIDNLMRQQIASSAFVIADLTHANNGAYWEAGYAEGLGKPVIYICEQSTFDDPKRRPHFDTNHSTTVMWSDANLQDFSDKLIATIRRSLGLL